MFLKTRDVAALRKKKDQSPNNTALRGHLSSALALI